MTTKTGTIADGIDRAREEATAHGHQLGPWQHYGNSLLEARCTRCQRTVWAGRHEAFGVPLSVSCDGPKA